MDTTIKKPTRVMQAQDDTVIVEIDDNYQSRRGIIGSKAQENMPAWEGTVISVGPGTKVANGEYNHIRCKPGDTVLFSPIGSTGWRDGDRKLVMLDRSQVWCTLHPDEEGD